MQENLPQAKYTLGQRVEIFGLLAVAGSVLLVYLTIIGFLYWGTTKVPATPDKVPAQFKGAEKPELLRIIEKHPTSSEHPRH
jgi:hypothetical protein